MWFCGSETLPFFLAEEFFNWSERNGGSQILCNFYGSTETMGAVIYHVIESKQDIEIKGKVPIGMFNLLTMNRQSLNIMIR